MYSFLKITLLDAPETISRTLAVQEDLSLGKLHQVLCILFQWNRKRDHEFQTPQCDFSDHPEGNGIVLEDHFTLEHCLLLGNDTFMYILDFQECYRHLISKIEWHGNTDGLLDQQVQCIDFHGQNPFSTQAKKDLSSLNLKLKNLLR